MKVCLSEYKKLRESIKRIYDNIDKVYSPALMSDVIFNSDGFHHLRYDGNRSERSKQNQMGKFNCFPSAINIIEKSTTIQEYRRSICTVGKKDRSGFQKTKIIEWFGMFAIMSFSKKIRVLVVVRRIGGENGSYHFWSVIPYWNIKGSRRIITSSSIEDC